MCCYLNGLKVSFFVQRRVRYCFLRFFTTEKSSQKDSESRKKIMKVLNVAEKNDAAKNIAQLLGRGNCQRRDGFSVYNKIYEFNMHLFNSECQMLMTSVSGHLLTYEFVSSYRKWSTCSPLSLFEAPVVKQCGEDNYVKIKRTLEKEVRSCAALIIWTDCDREGENIGYEIIDVCKAVKQNIRIYRAKFSEITHASIQRAIQTLGEPNKAISDAVDVRSELDLRIGAAFTRFQTMRLQKVFPRTLADMLISYGSCQFPTLGFVVERFLAIERFKSEPYWKIKVTDDHDGIYVEFRWARNRLFEELPCQVILDMCKEQPHATVEKVTGKPKSKWRPLPLDTVELEKQASRKLRLNAKETMKIAEKLYTQGFISYPRTETNIFPKELNLEPLVQHQVNNQTWGEFAQRVLDDGVSPRQGKKTDQAHPPIHPTKAATGLAGNEAVVYEFIVRHFLACVSKNAEGHETVVEIDIAGEKFVASGLQILAKNYLEVYIYEKWNAKEIHLYQQGQVFTPTGIEMPRENTSPPNLLTEADLIALMDKHGIGTDATHADHIDTIKSRQYVGLRDGIHFIPGKLGIGLVMGYDKMGFEMSKPNLRAELESDLKEICEGRKNPKDVLAAQVAKYRDVFKIALEKANLIDGALANYLDEAPTQAQELENVIPVDDPVVFKCPRCGLNMVLKDRANGAGKYIGCIGYPTCNNAIWLPQDVTGVEVLEAVCDRCPGDVHKLKVKMKPGSFPVLGTTYTACIGGCDPMFNDMMNIKNENLRRVDSQTDSGYGSFNETSRSSGGTSRSSGNTSRSSQSTNSRGASRGASRNVIGNVRGNATSGNRGSRGSSSAATNRVAPPPSSHGNFKRPAAPAAPPINTIMDRENMFPNWGATETDTVIMCDCHDRANRLTVSKDGPNKGRIFYACAKPRDAQCKFFMWAEESDTQERPTNNIPSQPRNSSQQRPPPPAPRATGSSDANSITCACGQPAVSRTVRKEGPNTGRQFWACPQGPGSPCNFFQWAEETNSSGGGDDHGGGWGGGGAGSYASWGGGGGGGGERGGGGRGGGTRGRGRGGSRSSSSATKRKCGLCHVEGHTKRTCPQNSMD